jgi:hypothetical protein
LRPQAFPVCEGSLTGPPKYSLTQCRSPRVAADAFHLPFLPKAFDFVLCSSLLHHFPDSEVIKLAAGLRRVARRALIVLDLERHPLAYGFLPMTKRLFGWSPLTVHDGPVSVAAAFRPAELAALVRASGADSTIVHRHRPWFRISAVVWARSAETAEQNPQRERFSWTNGQSRCGLGRNGDAIGDKPNICVVGGYGA